MKISLKNLTLIVLTVLCVCAISAVIGCKTDSENTDINVPAHTHSYISEVTPPTCTERGYTTYTCDCGDYYVNYYVNAMGHTLLTSVKENEITATCTKEGSYDEVVFCGVCNEKISSTHKTVNATGHTPKSAVIENEIPATCTKEGSYDEVVYCEGCNEKISSTHKTVNATGHTPKSAVIENEIPATCTKTGSYDEVVHCSECNTELNRIKKSVDKGPHTPAKAVIENEVSATCAKEGSYDEVVYCAECKTELNRTSKTTEKVAHNYINYICTVCGDDITPEPESYLEMRAYLNGYAVVGYVGNAASITIPSRFNDKDVVAIGRKASGGLAYCTSLQSITLPETILEINTNAFQYCTNLKEIHIPSCLDIAYNAFNYCTSLTEITLPENCVTIGSNLFVGCTSLRKVTINGGTVNSSIFGGCGMLTDVIIGEKITAINDGAFRYCTSLENLTVPYLNSNVGSLFGGKIYTCPDIDSMWAVDTVSRSVTVNGVTTYYAKPTTNSDWYLGGRWIEVDGVKLFNQEEPAEVLSWVTVAYPIINGVPYDRWRAPKEAKCKLYYVPVTLKSLTITDQLIDKNDKAFNNCDFEIIILKKFPITAINIVGASESYIDEFDLANYSLNINRSNGSTETIALSECLSNNEKELFNTVGTHAINISFEGFTIKFSVKINEHIFDTAALLSETFIYDGTEKRLVVTGIPDGVEIIYENNGQIEVGEYTVTAILTKQYYQSKTLTAQIKIYKPIYYSITYVFSGYNIENDNPNTYYENQNTIILNAPKQPYCEFLGWYSDAAFSYKITEISQGNYGDIILYAKWQSIFIIDGSAIIGLTPYGQMNYSIISIPSELEGVEITAIGYRAFYSNSKLTSITIPDSVTSIGDYAFSGCDKLNEVIICDVYLNYFNPKKTIGNYAFLNCSRLTQITIPVNIGYIGVCAFKGCNRLAAAIFENDYIWWRSTSSSFVTEEGFINELKNPSTAATCLKSTYCNYYWRAG